MKPNTVFVAFLSIAYVAVRLWRLTDSCLWFDEIFSIHAAEQPLGSLFWFVAQDLIHPPLFYVLLKFWIAVGGESLLWLRLFPVAFSIIALVPFLLLCRELKLKFASVCLALGMFAFNGALIKYSQEVRMYAPLLCLSLFSIWLFSRFYFRGKNIWILTIVNLLLVYTHYFGWFVIVAEIAAIAILQRIKIRHVLIMFGIAIVTYIPWIWALLQAAGSGSDVHQNIGWIERPGLQSLLIFVFDLVEPFYFQQSNAEPHSLLYISVPLVIAIAAAKVLYFVNWNRIEEKSAVYLLSIFSSLPMLTAFLLSWVLPVSIWGSRHLIVVFAPIIILIAIFVIETAIRPLRYLFASAILILTGSSFVLHAQAEQSRFIWCAWEKLANEWIATPHYSPEPKQLYVFEDMVAYHFWFGTREMKNYRTFVVKGIEDIQDDPAYFLPRGFEEIRKIGPSDITGDRVWIAFREPTRFDPPGVSYTGRGMGLPVTEFEKLGFVTEDIRKIDSGNQSAYLITMSKDQRFVQSSK